MIYNHANIISHLANIIPDLINIIPNLANIIADLANIIPDYNSHTPLTSSSISFVARRQTPLITKIYLPAEANDACWECIF
jgi:hypothetical protein